MTKSRVTIIAFHFRPDEAIGGVRPENWAIWLSGDYEVTVVTRAAPSCQDEGLPYNIIRPRSVLTSLVEWLAAWRRQHRIARWGRRARPREVRKMGSGAFVYRMPCLYDFWFFSALRASLKSRPDVVIATHSPYVTLLIAVAHKMLRPTTKIMLDFRDLWTANHTTVGVPLVRNLERALERISVSKADVVTTVSRGLAEYFEDNGNGHKTLVIYNAPAQKAVSAAAPSVSFRPKANILKLVYTGTIYSGLQDPTPLFRLLSRQRGDKTSSGMKVEFLVASKNPGDLPALIEQERVGGRVRLLGPLTRAQSIALQQQADILVLLESGDPEVKGILTGKVFEYLATDKPILLLGPGEGSELHALLTSHGRLLSLEDVDGVINGASVLPKHEVIDYSKISLGQLRRAMEFLHAN